jgi:curved DNA-binding protein CbpA
VAATVSPYATLGIPEGASREEAARAHRRLAKQFHPDVNPGPKAAERMRQINDAWRVLSSPKRRTPFDTGHSAPSWPGPGYGSEAGSRGTRSYGPRTRSAGWTAWPESRSAAARGARPVGRRNVPEPSFGDRPAIFIAAWVVLALLYFVGTWLGSMTP